MSLIQSSGVRKNAGTLIIRKEQGDDPNLIIKALSSLFFHKNSVYNLFWNHGAQVAMF